MTEVPGLVGHEAQSHRNQAASVLLPPAQDQRVMMIGGGAADAAAHATAEAINNVNVIDWPPTSRNTDTAPLQYARMHHNAVLLPDRTVLGWRQPDGRISASRPPSSPRSMTQRGRPGLGGRRQGAVAYSVAVLLPDGTVITAGSIRRAATKSCVSSSSIRRICLEGLGR